MSLARGPDRAPELLRRAAGARLVQRLLARDASLWAYDAGTQASIRDSLGWLDLPESMASRLPEVLEFTEEARREGIGRVLLLGMGGSSLAPEVFRRVLGDRPGWPALRVLDSVDPEAVAAAEAECPADKTLYLVSSKSGSTVEPLRLFDYFFGRARAALGEGAGRRFAAITDPGSSLEGLARERGFRRVFLNPPDVGGRYSALSLFGLVPAALAGADAAALLERARAARAACADEGPAEGNPGLLLGCRLAALAAAGRDKLTFLIAPELCWLGLWIEQLVAESCGKRGRGVIPVVGEPRLAPSDYGTDRAFVRIGLDGAPDAGPDAFSSALEAAGQPVIRLRLPDRLELGAEMYRWQFAVAVLGHFLELNPFDQPDVQAAKDRTLALLAGLGRSGGAAPGPLREEEKVALLLSRACRPAGEGLSGALAGLLSGLKPGGYLGLLAYLAPDGPYEEELEALARALLERTGVAVQRGYGPRYLHSTGQLHKGGPGNGVFLILCREDGPELAIPGAPYSFGRLLRAQALGDFQALEAAGRRVALAWLRGDARAALRLLAL